MGQWTVERNRKRAGRQGSKGLAESRILISGDEKDIAMDDIFVGRLMSSPVETVAPDTKAHIAAERMLDEGIGSVIVADDDGQLLGILTATDFVHIAAEQRWAADATVETYMTTDVTTTDANAEVRDIADLMIEERFHHVPVVDDEEGVVGIVTTTDITAYISKVQTPSPE